MLIEVVLVKNAAFRNPQNISTGVEQTLDISADLTELARTNVAVICAGAKSILDIPKTLEILETAGVPVISFGVPDFPAFFSR